MIFIEEIAYPVSKKKLDLKDNTTTIGSYINTLKKRNHRHRQDNNFSAVAQRSESRSSHRHGYARELTQHSRIPYSLEGNSGKESRYILESEEVNPATFSSQKT